MKQVYWFCIYYVRKNTCISENLNAIQAKAKKKKRRNDAVFFFFKSGFALLNTLTHSLYLLGSYFYSSCKYFVILMSVIFLYCMQRRTESGRLKDETDSSLNIRLQDIDLLRIPNFIKVMQE